MLQDPVLSTSDSLENAAIATKNQYEHPVSSFALANYYLFISFLTCNYLVVFMVIGTPRGRVVGKMQSISQVLLLLILPAANAYATNITGLIIPMEISLCATSEVPATSHLITTVSFHKSPISTRLSPIYGKSTCGGSRMWRNIVLDLTSSHSYFQDSSMD